MTHEERRPSQASEEEKKKTMGVERNPLKDRVGGLLGVCPAYTRETKPIETITAAARECRESYVVSRGVARDARKIDSSRQIDDSYSFFFFSQID